MSDTFKMTFSFRGEVIFEKEFGAVELSRILKGKGEVTKRRTKLPLLNQAKIDSYTNPDKRVSGSLNTEGYRQVWEFYCKGYSAQQISTMFRNAVSHDTISKAIRRIKAVKE